MTTLTEIESLIREHALPGTHDSIVEQTAERVYEHLGDDDDSLKHAVQGALAEAHGALALLTGGSKGERSIEQIVRLLTVLEPGSMEPGSRLDSGQVGDRAATDTLSEDDLVLVQHGDYLPRGYVYKQGRSYYFVDNGESESGEVIEFYSKDGSQYSATEHPLRLQKNSFIVFSDEETKSLEAYKLVVPWIGEPELVPVDPYAGWKNLLSAAEKGRGVSKAILALISEDDLHPVEKRVIMHEADRLLRCKYPELFSGYSYFSYEIALVALREEFAHRFQETGSLEILTQLMGELGFAEHADGRLELSEGLGDGNDQPGSAPVSPRRGHGLSRSSGLLSTEIPPSKDALREPSEVPRETKGDSDGTPEALAGIGIIGFANDPMRGILGSEFGHQTVFDGVQDYSMLGGAKVLIDGNTVKAAKVNPAKVRRNEVTSHLARVNGQWSIINGHKNSSAVRRFKTTDHHVFRQWLKKQLPRLSHQINANLRFSRQERLQILRAIDGGNKRRAVQLLRSKLHMRGGAGSAVVRPYLALGTSAAVFARTVRSPVMAMVVR